jgi:ESCRT-II complex subunit VPS22
MKYQSRQVIGIFLSFLICPLPLNLSSDDIFRAVATLRPLGSGYAILSVGNRKIIQSLPMELSSDSTTLLGVAERLGPLTFEIVLREISWSYARFQRAIDSLIAAEVVWIDTPTGDRKESPLYWFACFFVSTS